MNSWYYLEDAASCDEAERQFAKGTAMQRRIHVIAMTARFKAKAARYFEQNRPSRKGS